MIAVVVFPLMPQGVEHSNAVIADNPSIEWFFR